MFILVNYILFFCSFEEEFFNFYRFLKLKIKLLVLSLLLVFKFLSRRFILWIRFIIRIDKLDFFDCDFEVV